MSSTDMTTAPVDLDAPTSSGSRCEPPVSYMKEGPDRTILAPRPRWNPWAEALNNPHLRVTFAERSVLGNKMGICEFAKGTVTLRRDLNHSELRCTLGHELVHWERGPLPAGSEHNSDEEQLVDEIASARLITFEDLLAVVREYPSGSMTAWAYRLWVDTPTLRSRLKYLRPHEVAAIEEIRTEAQALVRSVGRILKLREKQLTEEAAADAT